MSISRLVVRIVVAGPMLLGVGLACSQNFPSRPVHVLTTASGGGNDIQIRMIASAVAPSLGQSVIVDNRNNTLIAAQAAATAPPDGYTLMYNGGSLWLAPLLRSTTPYEMKDFTPISQVAREIYLLTVQASLPAASLKELIALAKSRPGQLNYGSTTPGSDAHLAMELLKAMAGVNIVGIAYKSSPEVLASTISGQTHMTIMNPTVVAPQMKAGKVRVLAVASATPSALFPDLPTMAASGLPEFEWVSMTALFAPAKTPPAVINRLNQEVVRALNLSEIKDKFLATGAEAVASSPEQLAATLKADISRKARAIKEANITVE